MKLNLASALNFEIHYRTKKTQTGYVVEAHDVLGHFDYMVGYLELRPDATTPTILCVADVEVDRHYRKNGIGEGLYQHAINLTKQYGYEAFSQGSPVSARAERIWTNHLAKHYQIQKLDNGRLGIVLN